MSTVAGPCSLEQVTVAPFLLSGEACTHTDPISHAFFRVLVLKVDN